MMLTPAQNAVFRSVMEGSSTVWITGRQEGKTHLGALVAERLGGVLFAGNFMQTTETKRLYPDCNVRPPQNMKAMENISHPPMVAVFDNIDMYDYQQLQDMLKVSATVKLFLASHAGNASLRYVPMQTVITTLVASGVTLFST